jgi:DNA-binding NarL/FixJ family response regulator
VLVLDLNLPGLRGDQVCEAIVAAQIPTKVLILSASAEQHDVLEAVKVGATEYLFKSASRDDFLDAVRATALGKAVFTQVWLGWSLASSVEWPPRQPARRAPRCPG